MENNAGKVFGISQIKTILMQIKKTCNSVLGNYTQNVIKRVVYSPKTDVVYIYVSKYHYATILHKSLLSQLSERNQNNLQSPKVVEIQLDKIGDEGIVELMFSDVNMIRSNANSEITSPICI